MFFQLLPKLLLVCDLSSLLLLPNWKEQQIVLQSVKNFHSTQMVMSQSQALPHIRAWRYLFVSVPALEFIKKQSSDVATLMWLFWPQCDFQQVLRLGWAVLVLMRYKVTKVLGWSALGWIEETSKMLFFFLHTPVKGQLISVHVQWEENGGAVYSRLLLLH